MNFDRHILNLNSPVIFFPVRHHSPICARLIEELIIKIHPAAIAIEAPFDFNDRLEELFLPHELPIAIYSYVRFNNNIRRGAFYPFCIYSPEWQALQIGKKLNIPIQFIDLPWAEIAVIAFNTHRYGDANLAQSSYIDTLCEKLGVEDFNALWDLLFEIDPNLTLEEYLDRAHQFCFYARISDASLSTADWHREAFMVDCIKKTRADCSGQILVITGGFHSYALFRGVENLPFMESFNPNNFNEIELQEPIADRGIVLTPYDYQRLDALTGYDAGMPNPGFYEQIWRDRLANKNDTHHQILTEIVRDLRAQKQIFSLADLIAVESTALSLAALRGHAVVWRDDLIDSIIACLIKEPLNGEKIHPYLATIYEILRGNSKGCLAKGTNLPPLVKDIQILLKEYQLEAQTKSRIIVLSLEDDRDLARSRFLHQLRLLGIAGYQKIDGTDLISREDLAYFWEKWQIFEAANYEASCIENAIYGTTLAEATAAKLLELANHIGRDAEKAALLILDVCLIGFTHLNDSLEQKLVKAIDADSDFLRVTGALRHLLYLYYYDLVLGSSKNTKIGSILTKVFARALWLLESLGQIQDQDLKLLAAMKILLETLTRCEGFLNLDRTEFINILKHIRLDSAQIPLMRGAATGIIATLSAISTQEIKEIIISFSAPNLLGDFLTGLFSIARELIQINYDLLLSIDELIMTYDEESFLESLPALHLAFTYFNPREKHNIANTLIKAWGEKKQIDLPQLQISSETIAKAKKLEERLLESIHKYGLRG